MKKTNAFLAHVPVMNPQKDRNLFLGWEFDDAYTCLPHIFRCPPFLSMTRIPVKRVWIRVHAGRNVFWQIGAVAGWMSWNNIGPMATPKQPK